MGKDEYFWATNQTQKGLTGRTFNNLIYDFDLNRKKCLLSLFLRDERIFSVTKSDSSSKIYQAFRAAEDGEKVNQYILRENINLF